VGLLGEHNQLNALAAIGAAEHVGVAPELACAALASFENVRRRLELRGDGGGVTVYDDFAHHPTAIRTTVDGLRRKVGLSTHPGGVRAALQHHEAGHHEGPAALEPGSRPTWRFCHSGGLGWDAAEPLAPLGDGPVWPTRWTQRGGSIAAPLPGRATMCCA
jgi:UDP-N-acetylmuramate: L-alanyl-gamma-D-glutamyl-meso-diaminopimelate ligase